MLNAIFYLAIASGALAGYKKGATDTGYFFVSSGMAAYFSVWLLPFSLIVADYVPGEYKQYALSLILLVSFLVILFAVKEGIARLVTEYPILNSDSVFCEVSVVSSLVGGVFGALSGFALISFLLFCLSFVPFDFSVIVKDDLGAKADEKILAFSRRVNKMSHESWNTRQEEYLKELAGKYRQLPKPEEEVSEDGEGKDPADKKGKNEGSEPVLNVPTSTPAGEIPIARRLAGKAVNAATENQQRVADTAMDKTERERASKPKVRKRAKANLHKNENVPAEPEQSEVCKYVRFTLTVPLLKADGSDTSFKRKMDFGIALPEDGKVPEMVDAEIPLPVHNEPGVKIKRVMRLDFSTMELSRVEVLPQGMQIKYSVIDVE